MSEKTRDGSCYPLYPSVLILNYARCEEVLIITRVRRHAAPLVPAVAGACATVSPRFPEWSPNHLTGDARRRRNGREQVRGVTSPKSCSAQSPGRVLSASPERALRRRIWRS